MPSEWDATRYGTALRRDTRRFADAAERGLARPVPSCPGWSMRDLVWHLGEVQAFWAQVVAGRLTDPGGYVQPSRPDDGELLEWFRATADEVADVLEHADPIEPVWTWAAQKDVAFVQRRMAHEAAVHAWDAVAATGRSEPIEADLACDGIDELVDLFMPAAARADADPGPFSVALHASDRPGRWWLEVRGGELTVARSHLVADATVSATASQLLLMLWRRVPADLVAIEGETSAVDRLLARTELA